MKSGWILFIFCFSLLVFFATCKPAPKPIPGRYYSGVLFGIPYAIDAVGDSVDRTTQIDSIIHAFEMSFNVLDPNSIVSKYNAFSRTDTVFAFFDSTRAFGVVYDITRDLNMNTMQYFDPTMTPVKRSWLVVRASGAPEPNLDSLYNFVGFDGAKIDLNEMTRNGYEYRESNMRKADKRIEVDFTTIAAAVALDHIGDFLKNAGTLQFRIKYGRDVITYGSVVDSLNIIPLGVSTDSADQMIRMVNHAFSCKNAQDKAMMIDPTYGYPADNELVYVGVSAPTLAEAEGFSEAFMIMGLEKAAEYYSKNEESRIQSFMFYNQDKVMHNASTEGFDAMLISADSLKVP